MHVYKNTILKAKTIKNSKRRIFFLPKFDTNKQLEQNRKQIIRPELNGAENGAETCPPVTKTSCVQQFSHERFRLTRSGPRMSHTQTKKTERDVKTGQAGRKDEAEERASTFFGEHFPATAEWKMCEPLHDITVDVIGAGTVPIDRVWSFAADDVLRRSHGPSNSNRKPVLHTSTCRRMLGSENSDGAFRIHV